MEKYQTFRLNLATVFYWTKILLFWIITIACLQSETAFAQCNSNFRVSEDLCENDTVNFFFIGTAKALKWTYGDSLSGPLNIDTSMNGSHVYTGPGNYTITCIASDSNCADTSYLNLNIAKRPTLSFSSYNTCLGLTASFTSNISLDPTDSIKALSWNLDSNLIKSVPILSYSYTSAGNKAITLCVTTNAGCVDSIQKTVRIKDSIITTSDEDTLCQFDLIQFTASPQNEIPINWNWNFGDSTSSNVQSPQHTYQSPREMKVSLEVTYSDGDKCIYSGDSIYVRPVPDAEFILTTDTQQCFKGNKVCLSFSPNQAELQYRRVIWDNGGTNEPNPSDTTACYTYSDAFGGSYFISSELIDIYGCASSFSSAEQVVIREDIIASFDQSSAGGCFGATITVQNTSNTSPPAIAHYLWDFGNGILDSANWDSAQQLYTSNGFFSTTLSLRDTFGCVDTFKSKNSVENVYFAVDAKLDTTLNFCENNNNFIFSQTRMPGAVIRWNFGDGDSSFLYNTRHKYETFGKYVPVATVTKNGCQDTAILDTITVYGPVARFSIRNRFQCTIQDTVTFTNLSYVFENGPLQVSWQVFDPFAPNCTIDTKNGLNVDSNCNRSLDSLTFNHWFTPGTERCFYGKLVLVDTLTGCADSVVRSIPLMPPSADTGLRIVFSTTSPCPGPEEVKTIELDLSQTKPGCGQERWYVMWDSLCAEKSGNFDSNWVVNEYFHNYSYAESSCDSTGRVTIGLIVQNGRDSLGNVCRDTAFYHHILTLPLQNPSFNSTYNPDSIYCRNTSFDFYFTDTIQDTTQLVIWNFGDGTFDTTDNFNTVTHTYLNSGSYLVQVVLSHNNGCVATYDMMVSVGINKQYSFPENEVCLGDSIQINNISTYWDGKPFGAANLAGKTFWDTGDSLVPTKSGPSIYLNYSRIGDYPIQLYMEDSLGCKDTFDIPINARVFSVFPSWIELPDTLICPQVIQLYNTSSVFDSTTNFYHQDDSLQEQLWTFNQGTGSSSLKNPTKFFNVGMNVYRLRVENTRGCIDTLIDSTYLTIPKANFEVIGDTQGCQPHKTLFKNTSLNANNYTWFLRDNGNNVINSIGQEVPYEYKEYGLFYPELIAEFSFRRNGIKYSCYDTFPEYLSTASKPKIRVFERPVNRFSFSTNCKMQTTTFRNRTTLLTDTIQRVLWLFGDGDSSTLLSPTHRYADTGVYRVTMRTLSGNGCEQEIKRNIIISPDPIADFSFDNVCEGAFTNLADKTEAFNDRIYRWNWDFGDGSFSSIQKPQHLFKQDSVYVVSLAVTNRAGCSDTLSQGVEVYDKPTATFKSDSLCLYDSFTFKSTSYSNADTLLAYWEIGDGANSSKKKIRHLYSNAGEFETKLVVTTNNGCKDSSTHITKVFNLPKSSFFVNNDTQCLFGNTFEFKNNSTLEEGAIANQLWTINDSIIDTIYDYQYVSDTVGSFDVALISISNEGCKDTFSKQQVVLESPKTFISKSSKEICSQDELVIFQDLTKSNFGNKILARDWYINGDQVSTDTLFNYRFLKADTFAIKLIVTFSNNCKDTSYTSIIARPKPTSRFNIYELEKCLPRNKYTFTDSSYIADSTVLTLTWDLGNKDSSDKISFDYTYDKADTFKVRLTSTSAFGCSDTSFKDLVVFPQPEAKFIVDTPGMCLLHNQFSFNNLSTITSGTIDYRWKLGDIDTLTLADPTF
ncbi:PKD domain-containing protein, partial [Bacteroidia bacterium]|nr:PKD domain-containing protein [Bacteroidia bacterium]